jgi:hypothetical protein
VIDRLPSSSAVMDLTGPDRFWRVGGALLAALPSEITG